MTLLGTVINLHRFGATVRLADGRLAAVPQRDLDAHRGTYETSFNERSNLALEIRAKGNRLSAVLAGRAQQPAPSLTDEAFEARLADYLRETQDWAPPDQPQPFERHLTRKRRRAAQFSPAVSSGERTRRQHT